MKQGLCGRWESNGELHLVQGPARSQSGLQTIATGMPRRLESQKKSRVIFRPGPFILTFIIERLSKTVLCLYQCPGLWLSVPLKE